MNRSTARQSAPKRHLLFTAHIQRIATATPPHQVHHEFLRFAESMLEDQRARNLFRRMAEKSGIDQRYSCLSINPQYGPMDVSAYDVYRMGSFPGTRQRMEVFEKLARPLLHTALDRLRLSEGERRSIRHVIVTCCTGFYAPGLDFDTLDYLGLPQSTERTFVGFMGCYAAINGLKLARHIVRSDPASRVLLINLELCTLHLQQTQDLGEVLSFLIFGDGCAASLIGCAPIGLAIDDFTCVPVPNTRELITWRIGDGGFDMHLSGQVPSQIGSAMHEIKDQLPTPQTTELWAVHPGGRSVLDAVAEGLSLPANALDISRGVLRQFGNLSSATVMFVLAAMLESARAGQRGCALSFGPGLTAETMRFHAV